MPSFWSRLASSLRRGRNEPPAASAAATRDELPVAPDPTASLPLTSPPRTTSGTNAVATELAAAPSHETPRSLPLEDKIEQLPTSLRLGVDFGTSTTQVAY